MEIRDAVEADAEQLASLTGSPTDVMRNLIHDRTVRVAIDDADEVVGFVSFDAQQGTVHVTQLEGDRERCVTLLEEPISFARREGMSVELLVAAGDEQTRSAAEDTGFEDAGPGPFFDGTETVRYRLSPAGVDID